MFADLFIVLVQYYARIIFLEYNCKRFLKRAIRLVMGASRKVHATFLKVPLAQGLTKDEKLFIGDTCSLRPL